MIEIRRLARLDEAELRRLAAGYESRERWRVEVAEGADETVWRFVREPLPAPFVKAFPSPDEALLAVYRRAPAAGWAWGAFDGGACVGLALAEPQWNGGLMLWELHVAPGARGRGVGRALVAAAAAAGRAAGLRTLVVETQNTNGPAIAFYRRLGFRLEGVDLSLYGHRDQADGEVALYFKRPLVGPGEATARNR